MSNFICNIKSLSDGLNFSKDRKYILIKSEREVRVLLNRCKHQGGLFSQLDDKRLVCPIHGWILNVDTLNYEQPIGGGHIQDSLPVVIDESGNIFSKHSQAQNFHYSDKHPLDTNEFTIEHISHACAIFKGGNYSFATDPWCIGPAFVRGWWLSQVPPRDWLDKILQCDSIYISHNHSDHLNIPTLKVIAAHNPNVNILLPNFTSSSSVFLLKRLGFTSINPIPFNTYVDLSSDLKLMLLQDSAGRDDSGIYLTYKGWSILNTVDCQNLNDGNIPVVDVLMSSFASGSSGYPVCWDISPSDKKSILQKKRLAILNKIYLNALSSKARCFIPFAGYFEESHPLDKEIYDINTKNSPEDVSKYLYSKNLDIDVIYPIPGSYVDLKTFTQFNQIDFQESKIQSHASYIAFLDSPLISDNFSLDYYQSYFNWANYIGDDLVLHVLEATDDFKSILREFYVDFTYNLVSLTPPESIKTKRKLTMTVRSNVLHYVMKMGLPWEEISIGFNARFSRDPDIYNQGFWLHFQDKLPSIPQDLEYLFI